MKWLAHLHTINYHKWLVMQHCFKAGLYLQGITHDLSKYSPCEFFVGAKYYQGDRSPNAAERAEKGYSSAWLHHKGRNKHHLDYWMDYGFGNTHQLEGIEMPARYLVEMFCDRVAACKTYRRKNYCDHDPYDYYLRYKEQYIIHPNTQAQLELLLSMLAKQGEDAVFRYIRTHILHNAHK